MQEERTPVGWLDNMTVDQLGGPARVVLDRREGSKVFVRFADPCDGEPDRIPIYEGDEIMKPLYPVSHAPIHLSDEVGRIDDLVFAMRVVPVRRDGDVLFARTLRHEEPDNGQRVHLRPEDTLTIEPGGMVIELEAIDAEGSEGATGYVPLSPVLATWFLIGEHDEVRKRYLMSAARRLDAANVLLESVSELRTALHADDVDKQPGPEIRRKLWSLIGSAELAVIALGRVCDMVDRAAALLGGSTPPPPSDVVQRITAVTKIRNALEHIEDRAVGQVNKKPHPDALTIFNHVELLEHDKIVYGTHSLSFASDVPLLIAGARAYLKEMAGNS